VTGKTSEARERVEVRTAPDLINPFQLNAMEPADSAFIEDLGVGRLLDQMPFSAPASRTVALQMLVELQCDPATLEFRQQLLTDLLESQALRASLHQLLGSLLVINRQSNEFGWGSDLPTGLSLLRNYCQLLREPPDFSRAKSAGLQQLGEFLSTLERSPLYADIELFLEQMSNLGGLQLRVTVDDKGVPAEISTFKLLGGEEVKQPNFLHWGEDESPLHRRQALRDPGGLNHLGQQLQNFLSREFVAVIYRFNQAIADLAGLLDAVDVYWAMASCFENWRQRGIEICLPEILPMERREATIIAARNPLIESGGRGDQEAAEIVANDLTRSAEQNLLLITGANNGGKTTYIKTAGLIQLLGQKGLYVPARQASLSEVDGIFSHFVATDDIGRGEGRYRNELRRMRTILERATPYSLVILDEPCGGTDHREGQRQSLILLKGFHLLGAATFFTTHMHEMASAMSADQWPGVRQLQAVTAVDDDSGELHYLYQIAPGIAQRSYGEQIAATLGLGETEVLRVIREQAAERGYDQLLRGQSTR